MTITDADNDVYFFVFNIVNPGDDAIEVAWGHRWPDGMITWSTGNAEWMWGDLELVGGSLLLASGSATGRVCPIRSGKTGWWLDTVGQVPSDPNVVNAIDGVAVKATSSNVLPSYSLGPVSHIVGDPIQFFCP